MFIAMSIHHNIAKLDAAKWREQNYNFFLLKQQNDTLQLICVIWFTENTAKKNTQQYIIPNMKMENNPDSYLYNL
jgi:hypothetical protein